MSSTPLNKNNEAQKPVLIIGSSASAETTDILKKSEIFDVVRGSIGKFQSDEHFCELGFDEKAPAITKQKLKDATVVILQSTGEPVGDHVMHLLEMIHTAKRNGAREAVVITPFMAYSRQDRGFGGRCTSEAIDMFAKLLKSVGADKVITFAMHSQAGIRYCQDALGAGFFSLSTEETFKRFLKEKFPFSSEDLVIGAPDGAEKLHDEGQRRARGLAQALSSTFNENSMFYIRKTHTGTNKTKIMEFKGDVSGKDCVVVDDLVDGGSTIVNAARALKENGAKSVTCCLTHAVLTQGKISALENIMLTKTDGAFAVDHFVTTDSIPEAADKIAAFKRQYPDYADRISIIPLGHAILAEIKKQLMPRLDRAAQQRRAEIK